MFVYHMVYMKSRGNSSAWSFAVFVPISMRKSMVPKQGFANSAVLIAAPAFERLSPQPGKGAAGGGREGDGLLELMVTE